MRPLKTDYLVIDIINKWIGLFVNDDNHFLLNYIKYHYKEVNLKNITKFTQQNLENLTRYDFATALNNLIENNVLIKSLNILFTSEFNKYYITDNAAPVNCNDIIIIFVQSILECLIENIFLINVLFLKIQNKFKLLIEKTENRFFELKDSTKLKNCIELLFQCAFLKKILIQKKTGKYRSFELNRILLQDLEYLNMNLLFKTPMIYKPWSWEINKQKNIYEGGYYHSLQQSFEFGNNKIILNKSFLISWNYMQQIPFKINKRYLKWFTSRKIDFLLKDIKNCTKQDLIWYITGQLHKLSYLVFHQINRIALSFFIAFLFLKFKNIYIPISWECTTALYPISPLGFFFKKDFLRPLLVFSDYCRKGNKFQLLKILKKQSGDRVLFDKHFNKRGIFYSKKEFFFFWGLYYEPYNSMIGFGLGYHLLKINGFLFNDSLLLKLIDSISDTTNKSDDIYSFLIKEIESAILQDHKFWIQISKLWTAANKKQKKLFQSESEFRAWFKKICTDYILFKQIITSICLALQFKCIVNDTLDYMIKFFSKKFEKNLIFKKFLFVFCLKIQTVFYNMFPKQKMLKNFFVQLVKQCNNSVIFALNSESYSIHYNFVKSDFSNRMSVLSYYLLYLNSSLLIELSLQCKNKSLNIKIVNESFFTNFDQLKLINELYSAIFIKNFNVVVHPLFYLLKVNNLDFNKKFNLLISKLLKSEEKKTS